MQNVLDFMTANKLWFIIGGVILAVLIIALVVVAVTASKKRKAVKEVEQAAIHKDKKPAVKTDEKVFDKPQPAEQEVKTPKEVVKPIVSEQKDETQTIKIAEDEPEIKNEPISAPLENTEQKKKEKEAKIDKSALEAESAPSPILEERKEAAAVVAESAPEVIEKEEASESVKTEVKSPVKKKAAVTDGAKAEKVAPVAKTKKTYAGKWSVVEKAEGEYVSYLFASNGELMLTSEVYATVKGAQSGIETIKKNASAGNFEIHRDKNKNYYYKLKSASNKLLCVGESYTSRTACENSIESVKKYSETAVINQTVIEDKTLINYVPTGEVQKAKEGYQGKWVVRPDEDAFMAYLYASNGELLLVSESYSTENGAKSAINNIVKNAEANNFIIDKDKNGRFYYKLRNAQKSVLCVGETYEKFVSCVAAIESVKRFSSVAKLEA